MFVAGEGIRFGPPRTGFYINPSTSVNSKKSANNPQGRNESLPLVANNYEVNRILFIYEKIVDIGGGGGDIMYKRKEFSVLSLCKK